MHNHILIEELAVEVLMDNVIQPVFTRVVTVRSKIWFLWACLYLLLSPFQIPCYFLVAVVASFRLALANADNVIFVFASSILSFYQVSRKVFYICISVLSVTGFLQFLRTDSLLRVFLLRSMNSITISQSNLFLRKFTGLYFSNPFTRRLTLSSTIFVPVGDIVYTSRGVKVSLFEFPISTNLSFRSEVGDCMVLVLTVNTLGGSSVVRILEVEAPWGDKAVTFTMPDENLGRFISYLEHLVVDGEREQVICLYSTMYTRRRAMTLVETIEHFTRGLSLVKLEIPVLDLGFYRIY